MIKKLLMMSASIVLGCLITTASFAWPPSPDCKDARVVHKDALEGVQLCRDDIVDFDKGNFLTLLRESKRACMRVVRQVCPHGTYDDADPIDLEICRRVVVYRNDNGYIIGGEIYSEDGHYALISIERDEDGNIISMTVEIYGPNDPNDGTNEPIVIYTYPEDGGE